MSKGGVITRDYCIWLEIWFCREASVSNIDNFLWQAPPASKKKKEEEDVDPPQTMTVSKEQRFKDEKNMKVHVVFQWNDGHVCSARKAW